MFTLNQVVPWGRSFDEYRRMFALSDGDLRGRVLGCADGPASFNAEATRRGISILSADPLYRFDGEAIRERVTATYGQIMDQMRRNMHEYVWDDVRSWMIWAACEWRPWKRSWRTTMRANAMAVTWTRNCPLYLFRMNLLI